MLKLFYTLLLVLYGNVAVNAQQASFVNTARLVSFISLEQESYAPFRYGDKLFFTSNIQSDGTNLMPRLCSVECGENTVGPIDVSPINKSTNVSNMTLTPDGKAMYYTICRDGTQDKCTIWMRKKLYDGGWQAASKLPEQINLRPYTATQPCVGYDWRLNKYVLYFVSDRPGGKGGKDIWCSIMEKDGSYGQAMPLPFNTEKDEVTPFFHLGEKTLFFSSNGMKGYGGLDIFSSRMNDNGEWQKPINMGTALNTSYDETYFSFHSIVKKGYFASNRNRQAMDRVKGKYHIYEIDPVVELSIFVYNIHSMTSLYGTTAHVYDATTDQKFIFKEKPFETNLKVILWPDRDYKIVVLKDGFQPSVIELNTKGVVFPKVIEKDVRLFMDEMLIHSTRETHYQSPTPPEGQEEGEAIETGSKSKTVYKKRSAAQK